MSFPITYKKNIYFEFSKDVGIDQIINALIKQLKAENATEITIKNNTIDFKLKKSIFNFQYPASFKITEDKNRIKITYEFSLVQVFEISLIVIFFAALASKFSVYSLLKFSIIFLLIFYPVNIFFIGNALKKIAKSSYQSLLPENKSDYSQEQQNWINDPNRCPACGAYINEYTSKCPNCGLTLKHGKQIRSKTNQSINKNIKIKYHYKKT